MLRHVIAPARNFSQVPNDLIRHTRLSSDAVRMLTWQLSLHPDVPQSLSKTAERAGIKKRAFQRAKAQLLGEGFLHEWRQQAEYGHWTTVQLVSTIPLTADEALAVRDGLPDPASRDDGEAPAAARKSNVQVAPSAPERAARRPTPPATGTQPRKDSRKNTTNPPPALDAAPPSDVVDRVIAVDGPGTAEAEDLLRGLVRTNPALAVPAVKARKWAPLLAPWLADGLTHDQIRHTLTQGLADTRSPLGVLHWRLNNARPDTPPPAPQAAPPRLTGMRECQGHHTQPRLCHPQPGATRALCEDCRTTIPKAAATPSTPTPGYLTFRAARTATATARAL